MPNIYANNNVKYSTSRSLTELATALESSVNKITNDTGEMENCLLILMGRMNTAFIKIPKSEVTKYYNNCVKQLAVLLLLLFVTLPVKTVADCDSFLQNLVDKRFNKNIVIFCSSATLSVTIRALG